MEVSPSLVGGHLVVEDVDVGELVGSRHRCRASKGEDALIALGRRCRSGGGSRSSVLVVLVPRSSLFLMKLRLGVK